jgi:hypothetical protein
MDTSAKIGVERPIETNQRTRMIYVGGNASAMQGVKTATRRFTFIDRSPHRTASENNLPLLGDRSTGGSKST